MKKLLIMVMLAFLITLTSCGKKYSEAAYFETAKLTRTSTNIKGSKYKDIDIDQIYKKALLDFSYDTASKLLSDDNVMYSPISFYFALSQLAEIVKGETQVEILNALLISDIDVLRDGYDNLYKKVTYVNKSSTLSIANSIWLKKGYIYSQDILKILADKYHTSSYGVDFNDEKTKALIEEWISDYTGGKLGKGDFNDLDPLTVFIIINALYFDDEWDKKFDKQKNTKDNFKDVGEVTYMNNTLDGFYLDGPGYEASFLKFKNGMHISFILPNADVSIEDFLKDKDKLKMAFDTKTLQPFEISYKVPKFTYKSSFNLINFAKSMGIIKVFDGGDFTNFTNVGLYVSKMFQKTFIEIDEEGGRAAAYTGIVGNEKADPGERVDFILNRPFIYTIYSGEYPIFMGVVKNPNDNSEFNYE